MNRGMNIEAEKDMLSIILNYPDVMIEHGEKLSPDLFYDPFHRRLMGKIRNLVLEDVPIEISTLSNNPNEQHEISAIKLREKSIEFFDVFYKLLEECFIARNLYDLSEELMEVLPKDEQEPSEILHKVKFRLEKLDQLRATTLYTVDEIIETVVADYLEVYKQVSEGKKIEYKNSIPTPFPTLNKLLRRNGLAGGEVYIVAAPTSTGKTELCLNICSHAAIDLNRKVFIYSIEMSKKSLVERILLERSQVDSFSLERGTITSAEVERLKSAAQIIKQSGLVFEDNITGDIFDIITSIRKAHHQYKLDLVMIDYLQLIKNPAVRGTRNDEVASISRLLKQESTRLGIPFLVISQLSRKHLDEKRDPALHDLRDSGAIEQDADVVILLHTTDKERKNKVQAKTKLILAKQREGPVGEFTLVNQKTIQTFKEKKGLNINETAVDLMDEELPF